MFSDAAPVSNLTEEVSVTDSSPLYLEKPHLHKAQTVQLEHSAPLAQAD